MELAADTEEVRVDAEVLLGHEFVDVVVTDEEGGDSKIGRGRGEERCEDEEADF